MAVLPIRITGDPVLHSPAGAVKDFDDELAALVASMFETMDAAPGVGLAAPQIGSPLRVFVYNWGEGEKQWRGVAVNPELWISTTRVGAADAENDSEGCLSVPGERFPLRRSPLAILRAVDLHGEPFEVRAEGWLARIFQHEFDHLEGVLYVDRLEPVHAKVATRLIHKNGWGVPGLSWLPGVDDLEG
jgi:peptide deformylase